MGKKDKTTDNAKMKKYNANIFVQFCVTVGLIRKRTFIGGKEL